MNVLYFHMPWSVFFNMYSKWNLVVCTVDFGQSHVKEAFLWESIWVSQQERREIHVCTRKSAYVSVPNWQAIATDDQQETILIYLDKSKWLSFSSQAFCKRLKSFQHCISFILCIFCSHIQGRSMIFQTSCLSIWTGRFANSHPLLLLPTYVSIVAWFSVFFPSSTSIESSRTWCFHNFPV